MFKQKEWIFLGKSGDEYTFKIYKKAETYPQCEGIFIFAYTHPRGHLAGFETHALYIGSSDNLKKTMASPPKQDCVTKECWNCTYILVTENNQQQRNIVNDLRKATPLPC